MKSIQEFLLQLSEQDIRLWLEGNSLRCNAPQDVFTVALHNELVQRKAEIVSFLSQIARASDEMLEGILPAPPNSVLPLSPNQQGIWFVEQLEDNLATYNQAFALDFQGSLNVNVLEQALQEIIHRHAILRTNFIDRNGKPTQAIQELKDVQLSQIDISHLAEAERQSEIEQFTIAGIRRPFNLAQDRLFRISLFHLQDESHVLLFVIHHLIADGWSSGVIMQELGILYEAFLAGKPSPLPELSIQYADFSYWQQQQFETVLAKHLDYWLQQLDGAPPLLQLPTDRPRQSMRTNCGDAVTLELGSDLTKRLKRLSQQNGVTLFTLLLATFQVLLHRYTHQTDLCIGTTIANRDHRILESLVGFFVNTVVIRTQLSSNSSFRDFLKHVQQVVFEAQNHKDLPFHLLVERLQPQRDLSYTPLFQAVFVLEALGSNSIALDDLTLGRWETPVAVAKFDLNLAMQDTEKGLIARFEYSTDLFDAATIRRMMGHLQTLLIAIDQNPDQCLADLPLLTSAERQQLIEWNASTSTHFSREYCIHELFEAQVEKTPDAIAIAFGSRQITYYELNQRSNQLAHHLQTLGVAPNSLVGVCLERSIELVIGTLAVLKAGGAYVPLDPAYPQDRLNFMLSDAQVTILLTQQTLSPILSSSQAQMICLDADVKVFEQTSKANPTSPVTAENLAYVIYTSGSTGKPKGVQALHQGLLNLVFWHCSAFDVTSGDRATQLAGLAFDASIWEIYPYLVTGATLYLAEPETLQSPENLQSWLLEKAITITFIPTPFAEVLLSLDWPDQTALRIMLVGGDKLRQYPSQEIPFTVVNNYGPTENTVVTTSGIVAADVDQHWAPSIGRAISNVQIYILDGHHQLVPVGIPGELYVSGDSLTKGYLNRPERTKDSFISGKTLPHLATSNDAYFYKTGDLVRYRLDGNLEFLGRIDHQVKIRGFRIELGEIEATLTTHPTVEQAVVIVRDDDNNNQKLVAYLVYRDTSISSTSELKRWLREALPSYMIPSTFVPLESMPLTPNGKIDRRAFPEPDAIYSTPETSFAAPRDSIERAIAEAWTQVLGTGQISIHDNFFELGGHSLIATQIITRIETKFGVKLSLRNLFETPTIAELAIAAKAALEVAPKYKLPPIQKSFQSTHLPLSFAQNRLVFLQKLQPISPFYNIAISIHLQGVLKVEALEKSLNEILRRHDSLRTHFLDEGEHTYVIVKSFADFTLPIVDLSELSSAEQEVQKQHLALEAACQPFNLSTDQLLRIKLLQLSEIEHLMLLTMHHSIADGWSINVFMRELVALYQAFATHATPSLPELPIQYIDFAIWQNQHLQEDFLAAELAYWKGKLADAPPLLQLTTDKPRPSVQTFTGNAQLFTLPKPLVEALRSLSQQSGATLFMTLLAAFKVLLYRYTNVVDILIGVPIANRGQIDVESLIGYFVNTLVLRTDLGGNPSFQELLVRVREVALEAYAHQSLPFEKLLEELKLERSLGHSPLFQVMFSFEDILELHFETSDLIFDLSPIDTNTSKFDLSLNLVEMDDRLMGRLEYNTDLFEPDTITRLIGNFRTLLEGIAKEPSKLLSELPLLTQAEQQRLLDYNNTHIEFPNTRSVHELFESQVAQTSDATAVVFGNQRLTYRELNQRSNQLAHYLQSLGVGPDILVGICLERSLEMVIGLLAILKAGGAYVPLDPAYPLDHLAFVLSDSQAKVLLTQQSLLATLPSHQAEIICLDADYELFAQASQANPVSRTNPESLAYVIYTSGSTGRPKGVMALHQGLLNLVFWHQSSFNVTASDCATQLAGTAFDASVWEIYPYLTTGATLHLIDKAILQSPKLLQDWLITQDITVTFVPTPLAEILLSLSWPEQLALRIMLVGGDKLHQYPPATIPFQVVNNYGPTENTVVTTSGVVNSANLEIGRSPSIGKPVANVQVYILDSYFQPVPIGVPGEMYVGGASLTRGYLNRPELTTERFISDCSGTHLSLSPSSRLYKTGDWARHLSDGNIEFLGRLDDQVKIRGFRIELGEIEATLAKHPAVKEVIVITRVESGKEQYLVAYVAVADDQFDSLSAQVKAIEHELRHFLKTKLPEYMVPSAFVVLDAFPLTPNGKVDRRALPEPDRQSGLEATYVAPETSIEQDIAAIWRELLQLESVGAHDNFFTLGGHSLLLAKLQIALNESFNQELSIVDLFQYPTIRLLAAHIDQAQNTESLAQRAQERITTRQGRQASIKQSRQLRKQSRVGHTPEGGIR